MNVLNVVTYGHSSRSRDRTRDMWDPRLRWIPEHSIHMSTPKLRLAQSGSVKKRKMIYPYNKKEILVQVKIKGIRQVAKYSWYITGVDRGEMCSVGNMQQKAANMNTVTQWSDCRYILDASQSAQWALPGTRERMVCIKLLSTELSSLELDIQISFPCNRNQKLRTKFWCPKYKICLGITWSEPQ